MIKGLIGIICILIGFAIIIMGGYGTWNMLITGIVSCVDGAKATPVLAPMIAKGVAMIVFCGLPFLVGVICGWVFCKAGSEWL
jgi:hypothetical protein